MSYRIHSISGAPRSWRVLVALVAKRVDFEIVLLEASKGEHKAAPFLALNPRGRVPVLQDGDFVLRESLAILAYLERRHPEVPLFGATAEESARVWELVMDYDHELTLASGALIRPDFFRAPPPIDDGVRAKADALASELRSLAERVERGPFVLGERLTAADCVAFPQARLFARALERVPDAMGQLGFRRDTDLYRSLARWMKRIEGLPGYEKIAPPHWTNTTL